MSRLFNSNFFNSNTLVNIPTEIVTICFARQNGSTSEKSASFLAYLRPREAYAERYIEDERQKDHDKAGAD